MVYQICQIFSSMKEKLGLCLTGSVLCCLLLIDPLPPVIQAQQDDLLRQQLEKIIKHDTKISHDDIPGFVIGIIDGDSIFIETFGYSDNKLKTKLDPGASFQLGGLSKTFTALLCQLLADQQVIHLDSSIMNYLSLDWQNQKLTHLTPRQLLTHTSGLPTIPTNFPLDQDPRNRYARYTKDDLRKFFITLEVPVDTKFKYRHAHLNYAIIEIILEHATGTKFDQLLTEHIFRPFDMDCSTCSNAHTTLSLSPGYDRKAQVAEPWTFSSFSGSEGIQSCMRDLCIFIQHMLNGNDSHAASFQSLLPKHQKIPHSKRSYVATGWHLMQHKNKDPIYLHSGKTNGHAASIHFIKETKTAVVVLTNAPGQLDGLATLILRLINYNWKRKKP